MFLLGAYANTFIVSNHLCITFSAAAPQFIDDMEMRIGQY